MAVPRSSLFSRCLSAILVACLWNVATGTVPPYVQNNVDCQPAGLRVCTANDSGFHDISTAGTPVCVGDLGELKLNITFDTRAKNRYDFGVWVPYDPSTGLFPGGGKCSVGIPPIGTTSVDFFVNQDDKKNGEVADLCPDTGSDFNPSFITDVLSIKCKKGTGSLPFCVAYDNSAGNTCNSPSGAVASTPSKCVCFTTQPVYFPYYELKGTLVATTKCLGPDDNVIFTLSVTNTGTATAQNVQFSQSITPTGFTYYAGNACTEGPVGRYSCLGDILPGATKTVTIRVQAPAGFLSSAPTVSLTISNIAPANPSTDITAAVAITTMQMFSLCSSPPPPPACVAPPTNYPCKDCASVQHTVAGSARIVGTPLATTTVANLAACCAACADQDGCSYYQYRMTTSECTLLRSSNLPTTCMVNPDNSDYKVGGNCNPMVKGDPHFVGAHKTEYDFNGLPGETYCLVTDKNMQINMAIEGYEGGSPPALRTWITAMSFFWSAGGKVHTLMMRTRSGREVALGSTGYLAEARMDGESLPTLNGASLAEFTAPDAGLTVRFLGAGTYGAFATEKYVVSVADSFSLLVTLRPAMQSLWSETEAYVHFDLDMGPLKHTEDVHGVLGQTYRSDREDRTRFYQTVAAHIKGAMHALEEGPGAGFLDGVLADYRTPGLLDPSCPVSRFHGHEPVHMGNWGLSNWLRGAATKLAARVTGTDPQDS